MQTTWLERGTVSGRVALLLRSAEIQPLFIDLSDWIHQSNPPHTIPPMGGCNYRVGCLLVADTGVMIKGMPRVLDAVLQAATARPCCAPICPLVVSDWMPSAPITHRVTTTGRPD